MNSFMAFDSANTAAQVRRFLYDALPDGCEGAKCIGLFPSSSDVNQAEHKFSNLRVQAIEALGPDINLYSNVLSYIWLKLTGHDENDDPVVMMQGYQVFHDLALASMIGILASLNDSNKISVTQE